jgi:hypothetical protein
MEGHRNEEGKEMMRGRRGQEGIGATLNPAKWGKMPLQQN